MRRYVELLVISAPAQVPRSQLTGKVGISTRPNVSPHLVHSSKPRYFDILSQSERYMLGVT